MQKIFNMMLAIAMMILIVSCSKDDSNPVEPINKPKITLIYSDSVGLGDWIVIRGSNFGEECDSGIVSFGGFPAVKYERWDSTVIQVKVPYTAKSGKLWLVVNGEKSNEVSVRIGTPTINEMILIPAGTFQMGNTGAYSGRSIELPVHTVTISKPFYMSKYEVTQKQYDEVMGIKQSYSRSANQPVAEVSWNDAVAFCNALSRLEGLVPCYTINGTDVTCNFKANGYRLPTEAEWEYAAKAGTSTDFYSGSLLSSPGIDNNLDKIGWYFTNSPDKVHEVGQKEPNAFGLYDMSGNVEEWCYDRFGDYTNATVIDPTGPTSGVHRVLRGGRFLASASFCRSASRSINTLDFSYYDIGFRIVKSN